MSARVPVRAFLLLARRSLRRHALSTVVTAASAALAGGLVMAVWSLEAQSSAAFAGGGSGFDAVLGARGSQLQLVLSSVFYLDASPGNMPWTAYEALARDPRVRAAVPLATGDSYEGTRIVGTSPEFFALAAGGLRVRGGGHLFDPARKEAVLGSLAARRTGLHVGSRFHPSHGLSGGAAHEEQYEVVGVLEPTRGPIDRVIWAPTESVLRMGGHVLRGGGEVYEPRQGEEIPEERKEVSAVLVKLRGPQAGFSLDEEINRRGKDATFAWPIGRVVADLFEKLGLASRVLLLVAYLAVAVAAGSILASVYNAIRERRRDLAILRALGARRRTVFAAVVLESAATAGLGAAGSFAVCAAILGIAASLVRAQTGVSLDVLRFHPAFLITPPAMVLLGAAAGVLPAWKAFATDVAENLGPLS